MAIIGLTASDWKTIGELVSNLGLIPTMLLLVLMYVLRQNRDLHQQNIALLKKYSDVVISMVERSFPNHPTSQP